MLPLADILNKHVVSLSLWELPVQVYLKLLELDL